VNDLNEKKDYLQLELAHTQELIEYTIWVFQTENDGYDGVEFV
jgi:hypothetical protein